jgi:hypothetical protein
MGSPWLSGRSPEINGLAALRRQGYGLFAAKIWFKSHWALKRAKAAKTQQAAPKEAAVKKAVAKKTAATSTLAAAKTAS